MTVPRQAEMLANRLRKRARHLGKWARRQGVTCYRLYDRDIPEIALVIDWYEGRLHIARYQRRSDEQDPVKSDPDWLAAMAQAAAQALDVEPAQVFLKQRQRQRGSAQYQRQDSASERFIVHEGGHRFWVNLRDYLDTGLFLDHRPTRARVGAEAEGGGRFLNLFCYTGSFTVYAAAGGVRASVSVDISNTYLDWTRQNLAANGLTGPAHRVERADVLEFVQRVQSGFDLIVLDPPTFSNSKKMHGALDLQRDHVELINRTLALLNPRGVLYFSTNARGFTLNSRDLDVIVLEDITSATIDEDFRPHRRPHQTWRLVR